MFARSISQGAQLGPLEVWHAKEFADHLDRAREHIRPWVGPSFVTETADGARATLRRYAEAAAADTARLFGIWLDGTLVGGVMFVAFDATSGTCELGCWLEPAAEGRGLITASADILLDWAFDERGLHRAEWRCRSDNDRSAAVARRLGMRLEGVLRGAWLNAGVHHDKQIWAVLRGERIANRSPLSGGCSAAGGSPPGDPRPVVCTVPGRAGPASEESRTPPLVRMTTHHDEG